MAQELFGEEMAELYRLSGGSGLLAAGFGPEFKPETDDPILEKCIFPGSSKLPALLEKRGIEAVLITGTVTNICCKSSTRDARLPRYHGSRCKCCTL